MRKYSLTELLHMKTIITGHSDDLKFESTERRVWLSRLSVEDGAPYGNRVIVEKYLHGRWATVGYYKAE